MQKLYSIFDKKADTYDIIWQQKTSAVAIRSFIKMVNDKGNPQMGTQQNPMNANPEDYALVELGTFNEQTGEIKQEIKILMEAVDALQA